MKLSRLPLFFLLPLSLVAQEERRLTGPEVWQEVFVPALHNLYLREVPTTKKVEDTIKGHGGKIILDHGATRTTCPVVFDAMNFIAFSLGLEVKTHYEFPDKCLKAVDFQLPDNSGFKWFCTLVDFEKFPEPAATAIRNLNKDRTMRLSYSNWVYLTDLASGGAITLKEAEELVLGLRVAFWPAIAVSKESLFTVNEVSSEAANAMLLGSQFNHIAYRIDNETFPSPEGVEPIDHLYSVLEAEGFPLIPEIQGEPNTLLRQFSTLADELQFAVYSLDSENLGEEIAWPAKFIEFIQRGQMSNGSTFQGFITANAAKIYESTDH